MDIPLSLSLFIQKGGEFLRRVSERTLIRSSKFGKSLKWRPNFLINIKEIFIPTVAANRELPGYANKSATVFCDHCASHCSEEILRELARNGILVLVYPPHTSHLFQVLDVLLFGRLKVFRKYLPKGDNEDREIDHILRTFRAYEAVTTSMMIRASWEKAGFSYYQRDETFYLAVDEGRIRGRRIFATFGRGTIPSSPYWPR
jgi:hypothetical protein